MPSPPRSCRRARRSPGGCRGAGGQPLVRLRLQRRQGVTGRGLRHAYNLPPARRVGAGRVPFIVGLFYQGKVEPTVHTVRRRNVADCWAVARGEEKERRAAAIWGVVFACQDMDQPASVSRLRESILSATRIGCQARRRPVILRSEATKHVLSGAE